MFIHQYLGDFPCKTRGHPLVEVKVDGEARVVLEDLGCSNTLVRQVKTMVGGRGETNYD